MNPMKNVSKVQAKMNAPLLTGLLYSFATLLLLIIIVSFLTASSGLNEESLSGTVYVLHGLSLLIGGMTTGKRKGQKGWYHGGMMGLVYLVIIYMVGFLGFNATIGMQAAITAAVCFCGGALGGMVGVNMRK